MTTNTTTETNEVEDPQLEAIKADRMSAAIELVQYRNKDVPHWRWGLARHFAESPGSRLVRCLDDFTVAALQVLRARGNHAGLNPEAVKIFHEAIAMHEQNGLDRWRLEAHFLLRKRIGRRIARKLGLNIDMVKVFMKLFFDVRWRLSNRCWIRTYAIGSPADSCGEYDIASLLKNAAYFGNERFLDRMCAVVTGIDREKYSEEELEAAEFVVERSRLHTVRQPKRVWQLEMRLMGEREGAHPSSYHLPRKRRVTTTASEPSNLEAPIGGLEFPSFDHFGDHSFA